MKNRELYKRISLLFFLCIAQLTFQSDSYAKKKVELSLVEEERLSAIQNQVPLTYNKYVARYIEVYSIEQKSKAAIILARSEKYFPLYEQVFATYNLPDELKYLSIVESALVPSARSRVGASGLWQFMYSTAKEYKLKITPYVDERYDPTLSTIAAANYLNRMYNKFGDWLMAIASYNCGAGNVRKAIRRSGGKQDFWEIYPYLPRETRGYVPAYISAVYFMKYADVLGIYPNYEGVNLSPSVTLSTKNELEIHEVASKLGIDKAVLYELNPSLLSQIIPAGYELKVPSDKYDLLSSELNQLYTVSETKIRDLALHRKIRTKGVRGRITPIDPNMQRIIYTVKKGDNVGMIASWYNCGLANLKAWNAIRGNKIIVGQELAIYLHKDDMQWYARFDQFSDRLKNILSGDRALMRLYIDNRDKGFLYHKVVTGDNLWMLANQYEVGISEIKSFNDLDKHALKPNMYLKIKRL